MALCLRMAVAALGILLVGACGGDDDDGDEDAPAIGGEEDGGDPGGEAIALTVATNEGEGLSFEPVELRAATGTEVSLTLDNGSGSTLHDWTIEDIPIEAVSGEGAEHTVEAEEHGEESTSEEGDPEFDLHVAADAGETADLTFTVSADGSYTFFCSVDGHREAGMEGTLVVVE